MKLTLNLTPEAPNEVYAIISPVPSPVSVCSAWQIRKALNTAERRQEVEDYIASKEATQTEKDGWEYATEFRSDDLFVISVGFLLGLDETAVYDFILGASKL